MILILTNVLNKKCASTRSNKICTTGLRHVINALKISRVSTYHLCSSDFLWILKQIFKFNFKIEYYVIFMK